MPSKKTTTAMKRLFLISLMALFVLASFGQTAAKQAAPRKQEIKENVRYRLYPTENNWTLLKLDTRTGKIWQVQYSVNDNNRGEVVLNNTELTSGPNAENGRYMLYPTKNMYNFILLDQIDGKTWQVQWSFDMGNRMVLPIQY